MPRFGKVALATALLTAPVSAAENYVCSDPTGRMRYERKQPYADEAAAPRGEIWKTEIWHMFTSTVVWIHRAGEPPIQTQTNPPFELDWKALQPFDVKQSGTYETVHAFVPLILDPINANPVQAGFALCKITSS